MIHDNVVHIHGSADKILPVKFTKPDFIILKGGHLMTLNKAGLLTERLHKIFTE